ncbi:MAG TPA: hypothetical protein VN880_03160, partial [Solirubrobacteraceae bacterium]|nr:hypothetical protein [Solirubrobacteraceae bacterium]
EAAYRSADELGHAAAASNLGLLLENNGDLDGAELAYRRAADRGDVAGMFNLGALLEQQGDLDGAEKAYRLAGELGDPEMLEMAREALLNLGQSI